jgi:predicted small secreted protein
MTMEQRRAFLAAAAATAITLGSGILVGCNTVEGVGQDVEDLGDEIGDEAREQRRRN